MILMPNNVDLLQPVGIIWQAMNPRSAIEVLNNTQLPVFSILVRESEMERKNAILKQTYC